MPIFAMAMVGVFLLLWAGPRIGLGLGLGLEIVYLATFMAIVFSPLLQVQILGMRLRATVQEQGLVRLTPRMPQQQALSRLFVRRILAQTTLLMAQVALLLLAIVVVLDVPRGIAWEAVAMASPFFLLPSGVLGMISSKGSPLATWPVVRQLLKIVAIFVLYGLLNWVVALPWSVLACISAVAAVVTLVRDVRMIMNGPVVYPFHST
jgi:hypothetical protein